MKKINNEEFIKKAIAIHGSKYNYDLVEYKGSKEKVIIICPIHGEFLQVASSHLQGQGCKKCNIDFLADVKRLTTEKFIKKAILKHGNKYNYSKVEYINSITKVVIICPIHGEFLQTPHAHFNLDHGCEKCSFTKRTYTIQEIIEKFKNIHGYKYNYNKVFYKGIMLKVIITCPVHGDFLQKVADHCRGHGCPRCKESNGEKEISKFLDNLNIKYEREKRFKDCKNKKPLPFDFYLPDYNICIEYNGEQHYKAISFGNNKEEKEKNLIYIKCNDKIKSNYCEYNNIKLIIVKYNENVEDKLSFLKKEGRV